MHSRLALARIDRKDFMNPLSSITFNEKMSGPFAHGFTDPEKGAESGRTQNSSFTMHATISVADLDAFGADPNHTGQLVATVDYTPFGEGIQASHGVFKLFTPPDASGTKNMVYNFVIQHDGADYFFHGQKDVRNDAGGLDLWKDTTTLYSALHRGTDRSGPIVAAGILSLGLADVIGLVSTMRAMDGGGVQETAMAIGKFGRIFMGALWDTYSKHLGLGLAK